jgi:hypothetical protein
MYSYGGKEALVAFSDGSSQITGVDVNARYQNALNPVLPGPVQNYVSIILEGVKVQMAMSIRQITHKS